MKQKYAIVATYQGSVSYFNTEPGNAWYWTENVRNATLFDSLDTALSAFKKAHFVSETYGLSLVRVPFSN